MMNNPNIVHQLGVLYLLNVNHSYSRVGDKVILTEFFATLNADSLTSSILYRNPVEIERSKYLRGEYRASVRYDLSSISSDLTGLLGVAHTHMHISTPSDGYDFAWEIPALRDNKLWSIVITPDKVYFTGSNVGQYYYLPIDAFISAGKASGVTVSLPPLPQWH